MKNCFFTFMFLFLLIACNQVQKKALKTNTEISTGKEILLIGTFHYNNPGADVAKTKSFDILCDKSQQELEIISKAIKEYNPTKIFVEWPFDEQMELDSLYQLYQKGQYFTNDSMSNFYQKNEIFQLAFRAANACDHQKVYGIDYLNTEFPYGEVMMDIESNNQFELKEKIENTIADLTSDFDNLIDSGASLKDLTVASNSKEMRFASNDLHNNMLSIAGSVNDFNGIHLTTEWYKRNLYMWALIQKNITDEDERVMVLVGSSHAAMFEIFIDQNKTWSIKEFIEIMKD